MERILQVLIMSLLQKEDGRKTKGTSHTKILIGSITCLKMMNLMLFNISQSFERCVRSFTNAVTSEVNNNITRISFEVKLFFLFNYFNLVCSHSNHMNFIAKPIMCGQL